MLIVLVCCYISFCIPVPDNVMSSFWRFLRDKRNQQVLGWIGGAVVVVATDFGPLSIFFL